MIRHHGGVGISWSWFSFDSIYLLGFAIFWNLIVFQFIGDSFFNLFVTPHVLIGLYLTYSCITGLFNKTRITIDKRYLKVRHYPLPWWPAPTLKLNTIRQLYVACREGSEGEHNRTVKYYELMAVLVDGSRKRLLGKDRASSLEDYLYLEQALERALGVKPYPVAGEVRW